LVSVQTFFFPARPLSSLPCPFTPDKNSQSEVAPPPFSFSFCCSFHPLNPFTRSGPSSSESFVSRILSTWAFTLSPLGKLSLLCKNTIVAHLDCPPSFLYYRELHSSDFLAPYTPVNVSLQPLERSRYPSFSRSPLLSSDLPFFPPGLSFPPDA